MSLLDMSCVPCDSLRCHVIWMSHMPHVNDSNISMSGTCQTYEWVALDTHKNESHMKESQARKEPYILWKEPYIIWKEPYIMCAVEVWVIALAVDNVMWLRVENSIYTVKTSLHNDVKWALYTVKRRMHNVERVKDPESWRLQKIKWNDACKRHVVSKDQMKRRLQMTRWNVLWKEAPCKWNVVSKPADVVSKEQMILQMMTWCEKRFLFTRRVRSTHTATQCYTVQHSATHCNTLQHAATSFHMTQTEHTHGAHTCEHTQESSEIAQEAWNSQERMIQKNTTITTLLSRWYGRSLLSQLYSHQSNLTTLSHHDTEKFYSHNSALTSLLNSHDSTLLSRLNSTLTTLLSRWYGRTLLSQLHSHDSTQLSRLNSTLTTQLNSHDSTLPSHRWARVRDSLLRLKSLLGGSTYKKERKKETRWECIVRHDERGHNALCPLSSRDTSCLSLSPTQQVSLSPISRHIMSLSPTHHVSLSHSTSLAISYFTANATHQNPPNWETQSTQYLAVQIQIAILLLFLYRGIRDFRFGEFRGCSIFSGIGDRPHDVSLAIRVYTVERALCTVKRALYTVKRTLCNIITRYDMTCVCVCVW